MPKLSEGSVLADLLFFDVEVEGECFHTSRCRFVLNVLPKHTKKTLQIKN